MIHLSYRLSDESCAKNALIDWATADEMTLRYYLFFDDQIFVIDEADFSARWGWVTILDFAAGLVWVAEKLASGETEVQCDFTESDALIEFNRQDQRVLISTDYTTGRAEVGLDELRNAAESYARMVFEDATALYPPLKNNQSFLAWYPSQT